MRHAGHGQKDILHAQKNEDDLNSENGAGKQQEICEKKNDAPAHALVTFVEEEDSADPKKKF